MSQQHPVRRALIVVAKQPSPGQTKTCLTLSLTGEQASALYECFLRDTLALKQQAAAQIALTPIIAYLPERSEVYFRALAPDFDLLPQQGSDLSARLDNATTHCLMHGYDQVVIMDSDSPTLPAANRVQAFSALATADVSFGMCDDGGYYCIGLKQPAPPLFLNVTISTDTVIRDTLAQAAQAGLSVALLPQGYDIDYGTDLKRLIDELRFFRLDFCQSLDHPVEGDRQLCQFILTLHLQGRLWFSLRQPICGDGELLYARDPQVRDKKYARAAHHASKDQQRDHHHEIMLVDEHRLCGQPDVAGHERRHQPDQREQRPV